MTIRLREGTPADAEVCGRICYDAFAAINAAHGFPPDFPAPEAAVHMLGMMLAHPGFHVVVAETADGVPVGSNALDQRSAIAGVGPITVSPTIQNAGVGRRLMDAVIARAVERGAPGVRLVQAAFHCRSLSLYTKLGFDPREPLSCIQGPPLGITVPGHSVRRATRDDLAAGNRVCEHVHGISRGGELEDAIGLGTAVVVERSGSIVGYATGFAFFCHAVADSLPAMQALIGSAGEFQGPGILVPTRNAALLRWCLENGLRVTQPLTLMSMGTWHEPRGEWLPSISY